jgi:hypothetical protein
MEVFCSVRKESFNVQYPYILPKQCFGCNSRFIHNPSQPRILRIRGGHVAGCVLFVEDRDDEASNATNVKRV